MTGQSYQVVAFERDATGKIVTLGQIMKSTEGTQVLGIEPLPSDGVKVYFKAADPVTYKWIDNGFRKVTS